MAAAAGAGAYGGYKMKEKGYTVQNPITKEKKQPKECDWCLLASVSRAPASFSHASMSELKNYNTDGS